MGLKWFNNGTIELYIDTTKEDIPKGFKAGRTKKEWVSKTPKNCAICGKEFFPTNKNHSWCIECFNEVHQETTCPVCGKKFTQKYQNESCCSKSCAKQLQNNFKNPEILAKIARTNKLKYGVENPFNNPQTQQKARDNKVRITKNKLSKDASIIYNTLKNDGIHTNIEKEKIFLDCKFRGYLPFDFYIPKGKFNSELLIEYDGVQHSKATHFSSSISNNYKLFIHTQITDWIKDKYCIENNIPLIRIPFTKYGCKTFEAIYKSGYIVGKAQGYDKKLDVFDINDCDLINYKEPTFVIYSGITCSFKCDLESNNNICQNYHLTKQKIIRYDIDKCIDRFINQDISRSVTIQGLEPLDNLKQLLWFIYYFRKINNSPIIIWTGYTKEECVDLLFLIDKMQWKNIIIKFGRFIPDQESHYDEVLGINLASDNQYAERIS